MTDTTVQMIVTVACSGVGTLVGSLVGLRFGFRGVAVAAVVVASALAML